MVAVKDNFPMKIKIETEKNNLANVLKTLTKIHCFQLKFTKSYKKYSTV